MTTNEIKPFFRPQAVQAASGPGFNGRLIIRQPLPMRLTAGIALLLMVSMLLFLSNAHYTRKVRVVGQIVPAAGVINLIAPSTGRITRKFTYEEKKVREGEALLELRSERFSTGGDIDSQIDRELSDRKQERSKMLQLQTEDLLSSLKSLERREKSIRRELATRQDEITLQKEQIKSSEWKISSAKELAKSGYVSQSQLAGASMEHLAVLARQRALESNILAVQRQLQETQDEIGTARRKIGLIESQAKQEAGVIEQQLLEQRGRRVAIITAPTDGVVAGFGPEVGETVSTGATLAAFIPDGSPLQGRLRVPSRAMAFVEIGQNVALRVDAFPYQKFGEVNGVVTHVQQAPIKDGTASPLYDVTVGLDRQQMLAYGRHYSFKVGMTVEADIFQDRRRLIEWIFEPFISVAKGHVN
jgi:membrane fusion protein